MLELRVGISVIESHDSTHAVDELIAWESGGGAVAERSLLPRANRTPTVSPTSLHNFTRSMI